MWQLRFARVSIVPFGHVAAVACRAQARCSVLDHRTTESFEIRLDWCARGVVTSHAVTMSARWPEARGGGACETRELASAVVRARIEMRGFET